MAPEIQELIKKKGWVFQIPWRCPECNMSGRWRAGAEFEHMMRCVQCGAVWTPSRTEQINELIRDSKVFVDGDGI